MIIAGRDLTISGDSKDKYFQIYHQSNSYGDDITAFLSRTIKNDWVCLDVGANIGLTTIHMSMCGKGVHVYAFEPSKKNIEHLLKNVKPFAREITPVLTAVGSEEGF